MRPTVKLSEVWEIVTWTTPSKKESKYWWGSVPFVKPPYLWTDKMVVETEETLTEEWAKKWNLIPQNSIMVCCIWSLGKIWIAWRDLCTNQQINSIIFDDKKVDFKYWYYFCTTLEKIMNKMANQAIVQIINKSTFSNIQIPLPPLETQKVIVAKLDQLFAELDQAKEKIRIILDDTDKLWKSVLNKAFQGDWEMKKLGEICEVIAWQSPESDYYNENGEWLPFFQWKTEFTEKYIWEPKKWTTKTTKESLKNDILMSVRAPVWPVNINWFEKICIWRWLCAIRPWDNVKLDYVFDYLLSIQDKISWNRGSVFDSINRNQIESIELPVPSISEQEKIVEHLDQISKEVKALKSQYQSQLDNLEELKKSVLDKAFRWELVN